MIKSSQRRIALAWGYPQVCSRCAESLGARICDDVTIARGVVGVVVLVDVDELEGEERMGRRGVM